MTMNCTMDGDCVQTSEEGGGRGRVKEERNKH